MERIMATCPEKLLKAISTTTSLENIHGLQEALRPFGILVDVYEEEFSWIDASRILVFTIPGKKGE